ncbi:unnamed protein product, partial [Rotaria sp. Silwood2]
KRTKKIQNFFFSFIFYFFAEKTDFKQNPIEHVLIDTFTGKLFYMRSFDLKYSDVLNDDDLPDRSCVFYVTHPQTLSTANIREVFSQWNLLSYDRFDLTTHIVAVSLKKDTIETMLTKMRTNDKNLIITPYDEYKSIVKSLFPKLIDTKTIASTSIFQNVITNTALNAVYKTIRDPSFPACRFGIHQYEYSICL